MLPTMRFQFCKITTYVPSQMSATRVRYFQVASKCWTRPMSLQQGSTVTLRFVYHFFLWVKQPYFMYDTQNDFFQNNYNRFRNIQQYQVNNFCKVISRRGLASPSNDSHGNNESNVATPKQKLQQKAANAKMMINSVVN